ncbi:MAG: hypothetical protein C0512_15285 [Flavobacterium sp.]|nr:hypothetical protein [Flavobacterium sp.]
MYVQKNIPSKEKGKRQQNFFPKLLYIRNKEIGTLGVFELKVQAEKLLLDDFIVETELFQSSKIISNISYKNQYFRLVKKDTVI